MTVPSFPTWRGPCTVEEIAGLPRTFLIPHFKSCHIPHNSNPLLSWRDFTLTVAFVGRIAHLFQVIRPTRAPFVPHPIQQTMALHLPYAVLLLCLSFLLNLAVSKFCFNRRYKLPNVVPGWPFIGNTLDVPYPAGMWGIEMAKKYGEM